MSGCVPLFASEQQVCDVKIPNALDEAVTAAAVYAARRKRISGQTKLSLRDCLDNDIRVDDVARLEYLDT